MSIVSRSILASTSAFVLVLGVTACDVGTPSQSQASANSVRSQGSVSEEQMAAARALSVVSGGAQVGFESEFARAAACARAVEAIRKLAAGRGVTDESQDKILQQAAAFYTGVARDLAPPNEGAEIAGAEAPASQAEMRDEIRLGFNCLQTIEDFARK